MRFLGFEIPGNRFYRRCDGFAFIGTSNAILARLLQISTQPVPAAHGKRRAGAVRHLWKTWSTGANRHSHFPPIPQAGLGVSKEDFRRMLQLTIHDCTKLWRTRKPAKLLPGSRNRQIPFQERWLLLVCAVVKLIDLDPKTQKTSK